MTKQPGIESLTAHLWDLREKCQIRHCSAASDFLTEAELTAVMEIFPPSALIRYDGGYEEAAKKKVIFLYDEEDDFSDIVCLQAKIDQRFRKISHRDVLGALMHLQIDRHSFGDFWIDDGMLYIYTAEPMAQFLIDNLTRVNQLRIQLERTDKRPAQVFNTRSFTRVVASARLDALVAGMNVTASVPDFHALVAGILNCSRDHAKNMIREGLVSVDHRVLEAPDELCNNNVTISIRGSGRYVFKGLLRKTKSGRSAAEFMQYI